MILFFNPIESDESESCITKWGFFFLLDYKNTTINNYS
jgi:hypothetical protein